MKILKSKTFWFTLVSIVIVVAVFRYLFQHISPSDVIEVIRNVDRRALIIFLILSFAMSVFRTWRYLLLLGLAGYRPPKFSLFLTVLARNCTSDLLPARIGTLSYIFIVTTRLGIPIAPATSSFALAMLFDVVGLAPLILLAALFAGAESVIPTWALIVGAIILAIIPLGILYAFTFTIDFTKQKLKLLSMISNEKKESLIANLENIKADLIKIREANVFTPILILSVLIRVTKYAALYFFLYGLLVSFGYTFSDLNPAKAFLGICASELSASLPISGIAGFGLYQGTWSAIFEYLGFPGDIAKLTSISHHLFTQAYGYGLGIAAFFLLLLPYFKTEDALDETSKLQFRKFKFYFNSTGFITAVAAIIFFIISTTPVKINAKTHEVKEYLPPNGVASLSIDKDIVFDSNRSGSFGIYSINTKTLKIVPIVDSTQHEMYPDPSSDGKFIAYSKALSTSRLSPSQIWIYEVGTQKNSLINKDGVAPQFSADGKTIYFERNRRKVMAINIDGSNEREIFPLTRKNMKGYQVVKPRVSPDGKYVSFSSDKKGAWNAWAADLNSKKLFHIGKGCEPTWMPDSNSVVWIIKSGAKEGSGIFSKKIDGDTVIEVQDAGKPQGHEYFPYASKDQKWLLYGAAPPGQHSHIEDNYNLFAKDRISNEVFRLTFDTFTDRWPKFINKN